MSNPAPRMGRADTAQLFSRWAVRRRSVWDSRRSSVGRARAAVPAPPRAKSVLFLFLFGGPSHLDTFDPKPEAPDECRGEFRPIDTSVQRRADLRALAAHGPADASLGARPLDVVQSELRRSSVRGAGHAGRRRRTAARRGARRLAARLAFVVRGGRVFSTVGARFARQRRASRRNRRSRHRVVSGAKRRTAGGQVRSVSSPQQSGRSELSRRRQPADAGRPVDQAPGLQARTCWPRSISSNPSLEASFKTRNYDHDRQEAFRLLTNGRLARALAVEDEPAEVRDRYGRNAFGQSMLMARRLIEAGIPIVQANITNHAFWDTHYNNFTSLRGSVAAAVRPGDLRLDGRPARQRTARGNAGGHDGRVRADARSWFLPTD